MTTPTYFTLPPQEVDELANRARSQGVSEILVGVLTDTRAPGVVRARAMSKIHSRLIGGRRVHAHAA